MRRVLIQCSLRIKDTLGGGGGFCTLFGDCALVGGSNHKHYIQQFQSVP